MRIRISSIPPLATAALLMAAGACENPLATEEEQPAFSVVKGRGAVTKPFKASFTTASTGPTADEARCGPFPLEHQVGGGHATHLGRFTVDFTFCIDPTALLDDGKLTGDETVPYWDGVGTFTAANGDMLILEVEGAIRPSTRPGFDAEFLDDFMFTGGTGRFMNASGSGSTSSYVQLSPNYVVHRFTADLTVSPGS